MSELGSRWIQQDFIPTANQLDFLEDDDVLSQIPAQGKVFQFYLLLSFRFIINDIFIILDFQPVDIPIRPMEVLNASLYHLLLNLRLQLAHLIFKKLRIFGTN